MSQSGSLSNNNAQSSSKSKAKTNAVCVCVSESTNPDECFSENVTELINAGSCHMEAKGDGDIALYFFLQCFKYSSLLHCVPNVVTALITEAVC